MAIDAQADEAAFSKQYDAEQAQKAQQATSAKTDQQPSLLERFAAPVARVTTSMLDSAVSEAEQWGTAAKRVGQDAAAGAITGATNIADAAHSGLESAARHIKLYPGDPGADPNAPEPLGPIWDHAKSAILDFRDAIAVKDPNAVDSLTQGVAQLAVPFAGFSRALSSLHGIANVVAAGAATDATALAPHDMRMADVLAMARHTEGKLGEVLRTLAPDGSALNGYINFLTDRGNETEAEGRFKNVLDGFGVNLIATPLIHAAAVALKQGTAGVRYAIDNGIGSTGELVPPAPAAPKAAPAPAAPKDNTSALDAQYQAAQKQLSELHNSGADMGDPAVMQQAETLHRQLIDISGRRNAYLRQDPDMAPAFSRESPTGWKSAETSGGSPEDGSTLIDHPATKAFSDTLRAQMDKPEGAPVGQLAGALAKNLPEGKEGDFYREVLGRIAEVNPDSKVFTHSQSYEQLSGMTPREGLETHGSFQRADGSMHLYPGAFRNPARLTQVFAHEAVHSATVREMAANPRVYRAINQLTVVAADHPDLAGMLKTRSDKYGLTNPFEFVAEIESNPKFRAAMQKTRMPQADGSLGPRTVWDAYKDRIAGILGVGGVVAASPLFDQLLGKEKTGA